jgi:membrane associated rhomboid family serine protease
MVARSSGLDLYKYLGLHFFTAGDFNPVQFITYMFMHGGFSHIFFNMFAVFMFGITLEQVWGARRFLIYYFVTGIGAALIQELVWYIELRDVLAFSGELVSDGNITITKDELLNRFITVGASGSVFGILLAFGMMFPNTAIYVMFIPIPVKAKYFVIFYGLLELYLGFANHSGDNVAHFAHLGGMLFGFFMIKYWRRKDINDKDLNNDRFRFFK